MDGWTLLLAAALPVIRVGLLWFVGAVLATKRVGVITPACQRMMSSLTLNVFVPALMLEKLVKALSPENILLWWPIPTFVAINILLGLGLGAVVALVCAPKASRGVFVCTVALGNYSSLPIVLMTALCGDPHGPLYLLPDCEVRGIAYVMAGYWVGSLAAWTVAWRVMRPPVTYQDLEPSPSGEPSSVPEPTSTTTPAGSGASSGRWRRWARLLQPPVVATAAAFVLTLIPGAKAALFRPDGVLRPLGGCLETLSAGMVPVVMLLLGAGLMRSRDVGAPRLPVGTIVAGVVCRLVLTPVAGLGLLWAVDAAHLLAQHDLVFRVVLLLHQCAPGAVMLTTIANLHQHEVGTTSVLLFWQYLCVAPTLCLFLMAFFWCYATDSQPTPCLPNATSARC